MFWRIDQEGAKSRGGSAGFSGSSGPQWTESYNFEVGALGDPVTELTSAGRSVYSDVEVLAGSQSCRMRALIGETGFGNWGGIVTYPEVLARGDEVWVRVHTFFPTGFDTTAPGEGKRLKFLRVHVKSDIGGNQGYNDLYIVDNHPDDPAPWKWIFEGENMWVDVGVEPGDEITQNTWETYEVYYRFDNVNKDSGGMAVVRIWQNGILLKEITNRKTMVATTDLVDFTYIFTYWNGGAPQTQDMYMDDIKITSIQPLTTDAAGNPFIGV